MKHSMQTIVEMMEMLREDGLSSRVGQWLEAQEGSLRDGVMVMKGSGGWLFPECCPG
jgi:hypothetical protein